jgi:hypothetical protein
MLIGVGNLSSQTLSNFSVSSGITTSRIMGNNPGSMDMLNKDSAVSVIGGSFNGPQSGIEFRMTYGIDQEGDFRIPIGVDYTFFTANETIPVAKYYTVYLHHELKNLGIFLGFHYVFVKFPLAHAKAYAGLEARGNYIHNAKRGFETHWVFAPEDNVKFLVKSKDNAWRFGGTFRIGIEGDLIDRFQINFSTAFGVMNLIGKKIIRGELLTPITTFETEEKTVWNQYISLLIQYKL